MSRMLASIMIDVLSPEARDEIDVIIAFTTAVT